MNDKVRKVLGRATLFSFLAGVASAIIYIIIALILGGTFGGAMLGGSLITGAISFVIAECFFFGFMLYFSRKNLNKKST